MEQSLSRLAYKGSITEAIAEAKHQKKLFLVYISGDNQEPDLATSTWTDSTLADSILKYCILLQIAAGSTDSANFSALYPHKPPPCITAIGYNGLLLWQYDGFVTADILTSSIEKSWLSLHLQETTATYLAAALASKNQHIPETSGITSADQGSLSRENASSSSRKSSKVEPSASDKIVEETSCPQPASKDEKSKPHDKALVESSLVNEDGNSISVGEAGSSLDANCFSIAQDKSLPPQKMLSETHHRGADEEDSRKATEKEVEACTDEYGEVKNVNMLEPAARESNDVHLNIRLPDATTLQVKFTVMDSLKMVKDYVDENQTSSFGPYNLAIPYPRKVFREEDLSKRLWELNLSGRQTLIVVQQGHSSHQDKVVSSLNGQNNFDEGVSSNRNNNGYWGYVKGILSFFNPFSYLGGRVDSSDTSQESLNSKRLYGLNSSLQDNHRAAGRSYGVDSSNGTSATSRGGSKRRTMPPFGSNIHTLKRDEDRESDSSDKNTFWNGNSTQYGGDNDGK